MAKRKLMLIDGYSLIYRAFYAIRPLTTRSGQPTHAVYGFVNMLLRILDEEKPDYVAVAMDKGKTTFRNESYAEYKGTRQETPEDLISQFPWIRKVLDAMNIVVLEQEGFEADDIIGTLSAMGDQEGFETIIITGDRDALQLVSDDTKVMLTKKGISDMEIVDADKWHAQYGITPSQLIDVKGLMGDSSDNIPGVPGIGEKTALKLIQAFGSIDGVLANLDQVGGKKIQETLQDHAPQALLSRKLATIVRDMKLGIKLEELRVAEPDSNQLLQILETLEFNNLATRVQKRYGVSERTTVANPTEMSTVTQGHVHDITLLPITDQLWKEIFASHQLVVQIDPTESQVILVGDQDQAYKTVLNKAGEQMLAFPNDALRQVLQDSKIPKISYDVKRSYSVLMRSNLAMAGVICDPMIAAYLLDPGKNRYTMPDLALEYLQVDLPPDAGSDPLQLATYSKRLCPVMLDQLTQNDQLELFMNMEIPLAMILARMELNGIRVDGHQLTEMGILLGQRIERLTQEIFQAAGTEFNINSPKQMGEVLFEKLGLPFGRKTKTGYSTDVEVLTGLARIHPVADLILKYRQLVKLKGTYVDGLGNLINPETGRIHTTYNQTITTTGRISSTEPNLQNIPIRTEEGREIRKAFVPEKGGYSILAADYSQIELRVLAHISGDTTLTQAFFWGEDIHSRTAAEVFGIPIGEVTSSLRNKAKAVNFGIIYGISDYGLAVNLKISREEAKRYIESYFRRYPSVQFYMERVVEEAREKGFVETIMKRRRYLPDIHSRNFNVRSFAERTAMNTPIQGSAADIIKLAMVKVQTELDRRNMRTKMLLQVHDELIFEVPDEEMKLAIQVVRNEMENAYPLKVPLKVDMGTGPNWYDIKDIQEEDAQ